MVSTTSHEDRQDNTLAGWLALHSLTGGQCRALLRHAQLAGQGGGLAPAVEDEMDMRLDWDGETAWQAAARALAGWQVCEPGILEAVRDRTLRRFDLDPETYPRAFTLHEAAAGQVIVGCAFRHRVRDVVSVAHEFGHALQLAASGPRNMAPVLRETCAFLSERALAGMLADEAPVLARGVEHLWQAASGRFLNHYGPALEAVLDAPETGYEYRWNYPLARVLAIALARAPDPDRLGDLFAGRLETAALAQNLALV